MALQYKSIYAWWWLQSWFLNWLLNHQYMCYERLGVFWDHTESSGSGSCFLVRGTRLVFDVYTDPKVSGPKADKCRWTLIEIHLTAAMMLNQCRSKDQEVKRTLECLKRSANSQSLLISSDLLVVWQHGCLEGRFARAAGWLFLCLQGSFMVFNCSFSCMYYVFLLVAFKYYHNISLRIIDILVCFGSYTIRFTQQSDYGSELVYLS